jgi:hypothetical protein
VGDSDELLVSVCARCGTLKFWALPNANPRKAISLTSISLSELQNGSSKLYKSGNLGSYISINRCTKQCPPKIYGNVSFPVCSRTVSQGLSIWITYALITLGTLPLLLGAILAARQLWIAMESVISEVLYYPISYYMDVWDGLLWVALSSVLSFFLIHVLILTSTHYKKSKELLKEAGAWAWARWVTPICFSSLAFVMVVLTLLISLSAYLSSFGTQHIPLL